MISCARGLNSTRCRPPQHSSRRTTDTTLDCKMSLRVEATSVVDCRAHIAQRAHAAGASIVATDVILAVPAALDLFGSVSTSPPEALAAAWACTQSSTVHIVSPGVPCKNPCTNPCVRLRAATSAPSRPTAPLLLRTRHSKLTRGNSALKNLAIMRGHHAKPKRASATAPLRTQMHIRAREQRGVTIHTAQSHRPPHHNTICLFY